MIRKENWPELLYEFIETRRELVFSYGEHDCATMAADWVLEATGEDPLGALRGAWSDERSALRLLAEKSLRERASEALGEEIPPGLAQRGDLVLIDLAGREGLAICIGAMLVAPDETGITTAPMEHALAAWRI